MKDLYSFHEDLNDFERYYEVAKKAYLKIFERLGLVAKVTEASGGAFSEKVSYEFEVLSDAGEANILYCDACDFCVNVDDIKTYKEGDDCPRCGNDKLKPATAAEVGNVFDLGLKYPKAFDLTFSDKNGQRKYPIMGCYGIGISRTMGVIVEKFNDDKGIIWPENIAPFKVSLVSLGKTAERANDIYRLLTKAEIEVLWDDRDVPAGVKFADADLIGNPYRIVISDKSLEAGGVEMKKRNVEQSVIMSVDEVVKALS